MSESRSEPKGAGRQWQAKLDFYNTHTHTPVEQRGHTHRFSISRCLINRNSENSWFTSSCFTLSRSLSSYSELHVHTYAQSLTLNPLRKRAHTLTAKRTTLGALDLKTGSSYRKTLFWGVTVEWLLEKKKEKKEAFTVTSTILSLGVWVSLSENFK